MTSEVKVAFFSTVDFNNQYKNFFEAVCNFDRWSVEQLIRKAVVWKISTYDVVELARLNNNSQQVEFYCYELAILDLRTTHLIEYVKEAVATLENNEENEVVLSILDDMEAQLKKEAGDLIDLTYLVKSSEDLLTTIRSNIKDFQAIL